MHICYLIDTLANGGAETMLLRLLRAGGWGDTEHTVCYMGRSHDLRPEFEDAGVEVVDFGNIPTADPRSLKRAVRYFNGTDIDILHNHLPDSHVVGRIAGRLAGVDTIVSTHHNVSDSAAYESLTGTLERITRRVDSAEIAVSKAVRDSLRTNDGPEWSVIYNSIDLSGFSSAVSRASTNGLETEYDLEPGPVFINIGRYVEQKAQDDLVAAMDDVTDSEPDATLFIIGWGDREAALRSEIEQRGLEQSIFLTGRVPDVHPYYAVADAFVLSSVTEGFGIVLLEAMAAGLPVISTNLAGPREAIGDAGVIVSPENVEALADTMIQLCDESERQNYSQMVRSRVNRFDIHKAVEKHVELYNILR